ncbi:WD40-repeat-containing domain protein [Mycena floridula]|nr:WD40-repeat-containing domain protein [Mycena floridula]
MAAPWPPTCPFSLKMKIQVGFEICTFNEFPRWFSLLNDSELPPESSIEMSRYNDAVALGGRDHAAIYWRNSHRLVNIPLPERKENIDDNHVQVAWAWNGIDAPVVLCSYIRFVYIFNAKNGEMNITRGHGGPITSIAVSPSQPHIFCTTSRDFSTRIYNLTLEPRKEFPENPHCPPSTLPTLAGPAHGFQASEPEGTGKIGRCVIVLAGGRSGGHEGDVFGAAFHPFYPLLATCGMDRTIKIWYLFPRNLEGKVLVRLDKPVFSSSRIHKARVLSVEWATSDVLISHSAPSPMLAKSEKTLKLEPGCLVLWQWLGLRTMFPLDLTDYSPHIATCATDYHDSPAFKILSVSCFPEQTSQSHTAKLAPLGRLSTRQPLLLYTYPGSNKISVAALGQLPLSIKPTFPAATEIPVKDRIDRNLTKFYPRIPESWVSLTIPENERLESCATALDGKSIIGVGGKTIWIWA